MFMRGGYGITRSIASTCRAYSTTSSSPPQVAERSPAPKISTTNDVETDIATETDPRHGVTPEQLEDQYDLFSAADVLRSTFMKSEHPSKVRLRNRGIIERVVRDFDLSYDAEGGAQTHKRSHPENRRIMLEINDQPRDKVLAGLLGTQVFASITPEDLTRVVTQAAKTQAGLLALAQHQMQLRIYKQSITYNDPLRTLIALNHFIRHLEAQGMPVLPSIYLVAACSAAKTLNHTALKRYLSSLVTVLSQMGESLRHQEMEPLLEAIQTGFRGASDLDYKAAHELFLSATAPDLASPLEFLQRNLPASSYKLYISTLGILRLDNTLSSEWNKWSSKAGRSLENNLLFIQAFFDSQQPAQAWNILKSLSLPSPSESSSEPFSPRDVTSSEPAQTQKATSSSRPRQLNSVLSNAPPTLWKAMFDTADHMPPLPESVSKLIKRRFVGMLEDELIKLEKQLAVTWIPSKSSHGSKDMQDLQASTYSKESTGLTNPISSSKGSSKEITDRKGGPSEEGAEEIQGRHSKIKPDEFLRNLGGDAVRLS